MILLSDDLKNGDKMPSKHIFNGMGYSGENISPHLHWYNVPLNTKSLAITCFDPDAPTGSGWWHWGIANIPLDTEEILQGSGSGIVKLPNGSVQIRNDFGNSHYDGAAPPLGESHRYIFSIYALSVDNIEVDKQSSGALLGFNIQKYKISNASIIVRYE